MAVDQTPADSSKTLVVFDFDQSLVNEDSDDFVFRSFHPELARTLYARFEENPVWPDVFDDMLQVIADEKPHVTTEMIYNQLNQIPMQKRMSDAIRMAVDQFGADFKVISDGNTYYINGVLEHRHLAQHNSGVFANPAEFEELDDGRKWLRVRRYHADKGNPHGCSLCPSNMCKGAILDSIRKAQPYSRVIYVGDGGGDFCPATRLTENDLVCGRTDPTGNISYGLQQRIKSSPDAVKAHVAPWNSGEDIFRLFLQFFDVTQQE